MSALNAKRTIWDVFADDNDDLNNSKSALRSRVEDSLSQCLFDDQEAVVHIMNIGLTKDQFIDKVVDKLLDGSITFDDSWDNAEEMMQIENVAYDLVSKI